MEDKPYNSRQRSLDQEQEQRVNINNTDDRRSGSREVQGRYQHLRAAPRISGANFEFLNNDLNEVTKQ